MAYTTGEEEVNLNTLFPKYIFDYVVSTLEAAILSDPYRES